MIVFQHVTKQFGPNNVAVADVSFQINPGEFVFITGPSGSGKTTLMRLLIKEHLPSAGEILFLDQPLSQIPNSRVHKLRRQIGVIYQDYKLLPELNVWENIALPLYIIGESEQNIESRVTDLLKLVNLADKAELFPTQLSGGEAQRVSIARSLAVGPKVIFADEPTGNLDPETTLLIARLLHKINELGTTVLFTTHDLGVLEAFPKVRRIKLNNGQLVEDQGGPPQPAQTVTQATASADLVSTQPTTPTSAPASSTIAASAPTPAPASGPKTTGSKKMTTSVSKKASGTEADTLVEVKSVVNKPKVANSSDNSTSSDQDQTVAHSRLSSHPRIQLKLPQLPKLSWPWSKKTPITKSAEKVPEPDKPQE